MVCILAGFLCTDRILNFLESIPFLAWILSELQAFVSLAKNGRSVLTDYLLLSVPTVGSREHVLFVGKEINNTVSLGRFAESAWMMG